MFKMHEKGLFSIYNRNRPSAIYVSQINFVLTENYFHGHAFIFEIERRSVIIQVNAIKIISVELTYHPATGVCSIKLGA